MANLMNQPMYQRIKEDILHQIKTNLLSPGDRLPTEYQLMDHYQVSRITVSKALSELKSEGFCRFIHSSSLLKKGWSWGNRMMPEMSVSMQRFSR